ncbi:MAG TPA: ABC transporter permease, partial [Micromonosporaceae bacterium]
MTTPTLNSVYPPSVSDLLPKARDLAAELGAVPSRNRLMTEFRIGAPKATAIRDALLAEQSGEVVTTVTKIGESVTTVTVDGSGEPDGVSGSEPSPAGELISTTTVAEINAEPLAIPYGHPDTPTAPVAAMPRRKSVRTWPLVLLALPAFVAVWSGWVGLGSLTGFGVVHPLPGIADGFAINSAITLPVGVETYAAFALRVWISGAVPATARRFAKASAIGSLALGALG